MSLDKILGFIAPNQCLACGREGYVLCDKCVLSAGDQIPPRCLGCRKLSTEYKTCSSCNSWLKVRRVYVANNYDGVYERLVAELKFSLKRDTARPMSLMMSEVVSCFNYDFICPVPTAPSRIRSRGFDHARILSQGMEEISGVRSRNLLSRRTNVRQLGASRSKRLIQMQSEFYVNHPELVKNKSILLVDDVATTGATISGAASALIESGAKLVDAVVFAHKV